MKITSSIPKAWRHLRRYNQILTIFLRYGFTDIVDTARSNLVRRFGEKLFPYSQGKERRTMSRGVRLRKALEEAGPSFIKLGQILSMRPDILPADMAYELQRLHDEVKSLPFEAVRKVLVEELAGKPDDIFAHIEEKPLAAASIAQVHRARLKSGEEVILKIQRPDAKEIIDIDVEILLDLANILRKYFQERLAQDPVAIAQEFDVSIHRELDFVREGRNILRFRRNFADDDRLWVPAVYQELNTTRLLVMDYVAGIKASNVEQLDRAGIDRYTVARNGTALSFRQIFEFGFFHADPHPGNILVKENNVIALLDFGMVGQIDDETIDQIGALIVGVIKNDPARMIHALEELKVLDFDTDRRALKNDLKGIIDYFHGISIKQLQLKVILNDFFTVIQKHRLRFPTNLSLTLKALVTVDGLARVLYPDFDVLTELKPFIHKISMRRYDPRRRLKEAYIFLDDLVNLLEELPQNTRTILHNAARNRFSIRFEHHKLDNLIIALRQVSNRLSSALIIAALIVGSSLIFQSSIGPTLFGYPVIGLIGYLLASVLGLKLIWDMLRSGKST